MTSLVADHLWQSTVFAAVAWLVTLALRGNRARVRHAVWLTASLKFLIPFAMLVMLGSRVEWRKAPVAIAPSNYAIVMNQVSEPFAALTPLPAAAPRREIPWPSIALAIWACGVIGISISWLIRWRRIGAALRAGSVIELGIPIRAVVSPTTIEPGVFGIWRPVLMLPDGIVNRLPASQLNSVIEHELCHVRHHDNLIAALQMSIETIFWFHPLVWWIGKKMIAERERACDEAVLNKGNEPQVYAEAILNVCKLYVESPLECVAGVTGAGLKDRIKAIVSGRIAHELSVVKKVALSIAAIMAVAAPLAIGVWNAPFLHAQDARAQDPQVKDVPKWEAVSIKPCESGGGTQGRSGTAGPAGPGRLHLSCRTVASLAEGAYGIFSNGNGPNWNHFVFEGEPAWIKSEKYTIEGKAEDPQGQVMMQGPMMQALLEDRFKLKIRREIREVSVYNLTVAKGGPKNMKPSKPGGCIAFDFEHIPPPSPGVEFCGMIGRGVARDAAFGMFSVFGATMPVFADQLAPLLDRNVIDKTGIDGTFDIDLKIPLEDLTPPPAEDANSGRPFRRFRDDEIVFSAMRQLGMKLEPAKGPGTVFVIDSIERPTDNFTPPEEKPKPEADKAKPQASLPGRGMPFVAKPQQQAAAPVIEQKPLHFDAASLRSRIPVGGRGVLAVPRTGRGVGRLQFTTGRVAGVVINTLTLIQEAYGVKGYQLVGLPPWVQSERYDFEGKADDPATEPQLRQMMRTFLAERFGLTMHRESKEMTVFAMTAGRDGIKAPKADDPEPPGFQEAQDKYAKHMIVTGTAEMLADMLSGVPLIDMPVIDKTGSSERYRFLVGWDEDEGFLPSVARECGVKFEKQRAPVEVLVIDKIQKPDAN